MLFIKETTPFTKRIGLRLKERGLTTIDLVYFRPTSVGSKERQPLAPRILGPHPPRDVTRLDFLEHYHGPGLSPHLSRQQFFLNRLRAKRLRLISFKKSQFDVEKGEGLYGCGTALRIPVLSAGHGDFLSRIHCLRCSCFTSLSHCFNILSSG